MARVEHFAQIRDRSVRQLPQPVPPPDVPELDELAKRVIEKEAEIERLCAEIEAMKFPLGPFAGQRIARSVAKAHGVSFSDMISQRREKHLVRARQHAMWEMKRHTSLSYPQIAHILGRRDHTTVLHGIRRHTKRLAGEIA